MRVAVIAGWYPSENDRVNGVFVREHALAVALQHDVTVIADESSPARGLAPFRLVERDEEGLRTIRVVHRRPWMRKLGSLTFALGVLVAVRRLARRGERPDVLHAHVYAAGLSAVAAGRLIGAPVVITEHLSLFRLGRVTGLDRIVAKLAFAGADLVSPVSDELAGHLLSAGYRARRIEVVPNVVDTRRFHPGERESGHAGLRLLSVGRPSPVKGTDVLLEAMAVIHPARPGITLEIIGDGPDRAAYEARALELGLGDAVRFRGSRPPDEVAAAMREADLLLLPSRTENLPCVAIEAAASGLRVIASDVGGTSEVVSPDVGVLVPAEDPATLAAATLEALDDGAGAYDAGTAARLARERFGAEAVARRWTELYRSLPRRRRRRTSPSSRL
jgi:glycosyltransferase involved in cell wall biosynthesis